MRLAVAPARSRAISTGVYSEPSQPASQRFTSPSARTAQQPSLAFAGDQEVGLISLGNAHKLASLLVAWAGQEAVAPAKGGALRHAQTLGHLVEREALAQSLRLAHPLVSQMQPLEQSLQRACYLLALVVR